MEDLIKKLQETEPGVENVREVLLAEIKKRAHFIIKFRRNLNSIKWLGQGYKLGVGCDETLDELAHLRDELENIWSKVDMLNFVKTNSWLRPDAAWQD